MKRQRVSYSTYYYSCFSVSGLTLSVDVILSTHQREEEAAIAIANPTTAARLQRAAFYSLPPHWPKLMAPEIQKPLCMIMQEIKHGEEQK